jgi:hypothetical protein
MLGGFRPRRAYGKRWRRLAVVLALATAGALTATGIALAAASSNVWIFSFSPSNPHGLVTSGRLTFGTSTTYTGVPPTETTRIQLNFDDDFYFNPDSFPKCNPADISGSMTMQQALQQCGPGAGAANNAWLFPPTAALGNGKALFETAGEPSTACVLVFNGSGSTSEVLLFVRVKLEGQPIDCAAPTINTEGDTSFVARGDLKANPGASGADYTDPDNCSPPGFRRGCQIDVTNISPAGPTRLSQLFVRVARANYIRARCVDPPAGNRRWNVRSTFTYANPAGTQTANRSQTCT